MAARRVHDPALRAAAMAACLAGQSVGAIAREYKLPKTTVSRWRTEARASAGRSDDIGSLLLAYVRSGLETVTAMHAVMRNPTYLMKQSAGELAVLHGVQVDKLVRILESMQGGPIDG